MVVVLDQHLDQVVELTGYMVALEHLGDVDNCFSKPPYRLDFMVSQRHMHEAEKVVSDGLTVEDRRVLLDDARLLQATQAFDNPGGRQGDMPSQVPVRDSPVVLKPLKDREVDLVEIDRCATHERTG